MNAGNTAKSIFLECGFDIDALGESRIRGLCCTLKRQARKEADFADCRLDDRHRNARTAHEKELEARISQLEHELAYTCQEVEFLKKLQMADMEARRQWESKHQQK